MYWDLIKQLKGLQQETVDPADKVDMTEWHEYFNDLLNVQLQGDPMSDQKIHTEVEINESPPVSCVFNELNFEIKEHEVIKVIKSLKTHKATGLDGISNEMIKTGQQVLSKTSD